MIDTYLPAIMDSMTRVHRMCGIAPDRLRMNAELSEKMGKPMEIFGMKVGIDDRCPKDTFYIYLGVWFPEPTVNGNNAFAGRMTWCPEG